MIKNGLVQDHPHIISYGSRLVKFCIFKIANDSYGFKGFLFIHEIILFCILSHFGHLYFCLVCF